MLKDITIPIVLLALGIYFTAQGLIGFEQAKCDEYGEKSGRYTEFSTLSGCFVEYNGAMVLRDQIRISD